MIWIETLSRHREIVARVHAGDTATIGRGYDNDAIVDDPCVAPRHARVCRNEDGALIVEDLASRNGIYDEDGKRRQAVRLTGNTLFRVGQTWLRVRDETFRVAPECVMLPGKRLWPWLLLALTLAFGTCFLSRWQADVFERSNVVTQYGMPLLWFALIASVWVVFWAVLTRLFAGRTRVIPHAIVALTGFAIVTVADSLRSWLSFAFSWRALADYGFVFFWFLAAVVFYAHLRIISARHLPHKAAIVSVLALCICLAQWLESNPFSGEDVSDSGFYPGKLYPPSWRIVEPRTEEQFFGHVRALKGAVDELRARSARTETPAGKDDAHPEGNRTPQAKGETWDGTK
ncbi:MAG: FHA domain-containing protein [Azoarcus sp.]|nr:FHA domain-containing protein [Azoarcus sp.]